MQARFRHYERAAGAFVLSSLIGGIFFLGWVAYKRGWFSATTAYYTEVVSAEGVRVGANVEMAGIRVGTVDRIELDSGNSIKLRLSVFNKYRDRIRKDSKVQLLRPFVIGEKVLYLTMGSPEEDILPPESRLPSEDVLGLTELFNGSRLTPYIETLSAVMGELKSLIDSMLKAKGSNRLAKSFESIPPLLSRMGDLMGEIATLTKQMNANNRTGRVMESLATAGDSFGELMAGENGSNMAKDLSRLVENLATMTDEFKKVLPAISAVAPDLPRSGRRVVEALDEAVVVLKAMQRSWLLKVPAREVREEEAKTEAERKPASAPETPKD